MKIRSNRRATLSFELFERRLLLAADVSSFSHIDFPGESHHVEEVQRFSEIEHEDSIDSESDDFDELDSDDDEKDEFFSTEEHEDHDREDEQEKIREQAFKFETRTPDKTIPTQAVSSPAEALESSSSELLELKEPLESRLDSTEIAQASSLTIPIFEQAVESQSTSSPPVQRSEVQAHGTTQISTQEPNAEITLAETVATRSDGDPQSDSLTAVESASMTELQDVDGDLAERPDQSDLPSAIYDLAFSITKSIVPVSEVLLGIASAGDIEAIQVALNSLLNDLGETRIETITFLEQNSASILTTAIGLGLATAAYCYHTRRTNSNIKQEEIDNHFSVNMYPECFGLAGGYRYDR